MVNETQTGIVKTSTPSTTGGIVPLPVDETRNISMGLLREQPPPTIEITPQAEQIKTVSNVLTWSSGGYGSGTRRDMYLDGQYYGTVQIPEQYKGKEEEYMRMTFPGKTMPSEVTQQQQEEAARVAKAEAERIEAERHASIVEGEARMHDFTRFGGGIGTPPLEKPIPAVVGVESAKVSEIPKVVGIEAMKTAELKVAQERMGTLVPTPETTKVEAVVTPKIETYSGLPSSIPTLAQLGITQKTPTELKGMFEGGKVIPLSEGQKAASELYTFPLAEKVLKSTRTYRESLENVLPGTGVGQQIVKGVLGAPAGLIETVAIIPPVAEFALTHPEQLPTAVKTGFPEMVTGMKEQLTTMPIQTLTEFAVMGKVAENIPKIKTPDIIKTPLTDVGAKITSLTKETGLPKTSREFTGKIEVKTISIEPKLDIIDITKMEVLPSPKEIGGVKIEPRFTEPEPFKTDVIDISKPIIPELSKMEILPSPKYIGKFEVKPRYTTIEPIKTEVIDISKAEPMLSSKYTGEFKPVELPKPEPKPEIKLPKAPGEFKGEMKLEPIKPEPKGEFKEVKSGGTVTLQRVKAEVKEKPLEIIDLTKMEQMKTPIFEMPKIEKVKVKPEIKTKVEAKEKSRPTFELFQEPKTNPKAKEFIRQERPYAKTKEFTRPQMKVTEIKTTELNMLPISIPKIKQKQTEKEALLYKTIVSLKPISELKPIITTKQVQKTSQITSPFAITIPRITTTTTPITTTKQIPKQFQPDTTITPTRIRRPEPTKIKIPKPKKEADEDKTLLKREKLTDYEKYQRKARIRSAETFGEIFGTKKTKKR